MVGQHEDPLEGFELLKGLDLDELDAIVEDEKKRKAKAKVTRFANKVEKAIVMVKGYKMSYEDAGRELRVSGDEVRKWIEELEAGRLIEILKLASEWKSQR